MNRRIAVRNAVERNESDVEFVDTTWSDTEEINHVRERWIREMREEK